MKPPASKPPATKVTAIGVTPKAGSGGAAEHPETVPIWPVLPMPTPAPLHNKYDALMDSEDEDGDESDVVKALSAITSNITLASQHTSQKSRRAKSRPLKRKLLTLSTLLGTKLLKSQNVVKNPQGRKRPPRKVREDRRSWKLRGEL